MTVLTCGKEQPGITTEKDRAHARSHIEVWHPMQVDLAALPTGSKYVVAESAGHYIHHDQPQLVVDALLDMVRRVRT
ncbi:alpha/beta hydrolase [Nonomuraea sp. NPDC050404]|uniref:alpha/beta hydrolase n=1 Tax=Nonomuraea sp. NPDC050404 TaxID=3155783 RepID=UPI003405775D